MRRIQISQEDVEDKERLRQRLDNAYGNIYSLLENVTLLQDQIAKLQSGAQANSAPGLSTRDRALLEQFAVGSTASGAPPQNALIPLVSSLPPPASSVDGQVVKLSTDGQIYRFDVATGAWQNFTVGAHNILSATHSDSLAAGVVRGDVITGNFTPKWARLPIGTAYQIFRVNGAGLDPEWGAIIDAMLPTTMTEKSFGTGVDANLLKLLGAHNSYMEIVTVSEEVNLAGVVTKDTTADLLPGSSLILPVLALITQTISGGGVTSFSVGDTTTATRFQSANTNLTVSTGFWIYEHWTTTLGLKIAQPGADKIRTTLDAAPTQGKIRYVTMALVGSPPTT